MTKKTRILLTASATTIALAVFVPMFLGLRLDHLMTLRLVFSEPLQPTPEQRVEIEAWLRENAIDLKTVQPGSPFDDLRRLKPMFVDAQIVALGEDAHLNRTFSRAKHRLVEYLVTELDFTVFAIEATFAGALELNDYILTGNGDPHRALAALSYPAWNTEAILDMIIWMRQYNAAHDKKLKFYGFDNKPASGSALAVWEYLSRTEATGDYEPLLSTMMNPWTAYQLTGGHPGSGLKPEIRRAIEQAKRLIADLETKAPATAEPTATPSGIDSRKQWALALQHARVLLQHLEFYGAQSIAEASALRDKAMAENVRWLIDYEDRAKTILWAANAHISAGHGSGCMGDYLRRTYGDDMVVAALLDNRKSPESDDRKPSTRPHILEDGTLQTMLTRAGLDIAVLDFRGLPGGVVSRYFNAPLNTRFGARRIYPLSYDAVVFVESTSNARLIEGFRRTPTSMLEAPSNLDFEGIDAGRLKDWISKRGQTRAEYQVVGSDEEPFQGDICGAIERIPGRSFNGSYGNIYQLIKGAGFRGRVRFSAAARATAGDAYLYLMVEKTAKSKFPASFHQILIASDIWREYRLEAEADEETKAVVYGLAYTGQDAAYIDNAKIETLRRDPQLPPTGAVEVRVLSGP